MQATVFLTIEAGKKHALKPLPRELLEALKSAEVTHKDEGRSGFQLAFQIGRNSQYELSLNDYTALSRSSQRQRIHDFLKPFLRVRIQVTVNAVSHVLMDGVITNHQFAPSLEVGGSTFTVTGEDVSVMMDLEEKTKRFRGRRADGIVRGIVSTYSQDYGLTPEIHTPSEQDQPSQNGRIPAQQGTDLQYVNSLAQQHGYVFYIIPGSNRINTAYWGPPKREKQIQVPLSFNFQGYGNVESVSFQYNALAPTKAAGVVQRREVFRVEQTTRETLTAKPALNNQDAVKLKQFRTTGRRRNRAQIEAQSLVDKSVDNVISANCEVDTAHYGGVFLLRGLVPLRGVGYSYDGLYYIKSITHKFSRGEYKQSLSLTRDGLGSTLQRVSV